MKNIKLLLVAMLMCMVTNGMAQDKNTPDTKRAYYIYSWIQLRWANKANLGIFRKRKKTKTQHYENRRW